MRYKIIEHFKITNKDELRYIQSLDIDPDLKKIDLNSSEDFLTQLAKIKGIDQEQLEKILYKNIMLAYLIEKHYVDLVVFLNNTSIPIEAKLKRVGRKILTPEEINSIINGAFLKVFVIYTIINLPLIPILHYLFPPYIAWLKIFVLGIIFLLSGLINLAFKDILVKYYFKKIWR